MTVLVMVLLVLSGCSSAVALPDSGDLVGVWTHDSREGRTVLVLGADGTFDLTGMPLRVLRHSAQPQPDIVADLTGTWTGEIESEMYPPYMWLRIERSAVFDPGLSEHLYLDHADGDWVLYFIEDPADTARPFEFSRQ